MVQTLPWRRNWLPYFRSPPPCRTDDTGHLKLELSEVSDAPVFVVVSASEKPHENCWYRSACVRPGALGQHALEIYLARAAIADESGFSQADLAGLLEQTKKQVPDLERISGTITQDGIALTCVGKGGKASGRLLLSPNQSSDLKTILHHSVEDFRLELPGPSWLVGLLVSRNAIETSIQNGLRNLALRSTNGCVSAPTSFSRTRFRRRRPHCTPCWPIGPR